MKAPTLYKKRNCRVWFCVCWRRAKKPVHHSTGKISREIAGEYANLQQAHYEALASRPVVFRPVETQLEFTPPRLRMAA